MPSPSDDAIALVVPGAPGGGTGGSDGTNGSDGSDGSGGLGSGGSGSNPDPATAAGLSGPPTAISVLTGVLPAVTVTTGAVTLAMAFLVLARRRRQRQEALTDEELREAAGRGYDLVAAPAPMRAIPAAVAAAGVVVIEPPGDIDAHLPRWRRPSLMEARKGDPLRSVTTALPLTFGGSIDDSVDGFERRLVRYRLVSLLSAPDEIQGQEIGVLDEGDEVVLLEKRGTYWRVLCPDGREGWLHKMTLGDVVIGSGAEVSSWTAADDGPPTGGFEDVLRAYEAARRQLGDAGAQT